MVTPWFMVSGVLIGIGVLKVVPQSADELNMMVERWFGATP
jgi:hypothetical protein